MRNVKTSKFKKIFGAVLSSLIFGTLFALIPIFMFLAREEINLPMFLYLIINIIFIFPIIGIIYNLIVRIKEIKGGEEDEASKY